jgi:hypothetical protein
MSSNAIETVVIELNQTNATSVALGSDGYPENGNYKCDLSEPVTIYDGDQISLRLATIDSQRGDSETIVLSDPLPVSISFSYYDIDYPVTSDDKYVEDGSVPWVTAGTGIDTETFQKCSGYMNQDEYQLTSIKYKVHPKGVDPRNNDSLDNKVNIIPLFSWMDLQHVHQTSKHPQFDNNRIEKKSLGKITEYEYSGVSDTVTNECVCRNISGKPIKYIEGTLKIIGVVAWQYNFITLDPAQFRYYVPDRIRYLADQDVVVQIGTGTRNLLQRTAGITIPRVKYNKNDLATYITRAFTEVGLANILDTGGDQIIIADTDLNIRTDDSQFDSLVFRINKTDDTDVTFANNTTYQYLHKTSDPVIVTKPKILIGARKFAIEYGLDGSIFQISAAHQSFYIPSVVDGKDENSGLEGVGIYQKVDGTGSRRNYTVSSTTGVIIHDMQPKTFWDQTLGLYNNVVVPLTEDSNGVFFWTDLNTVDKYPTESYKSSIYSNTNSRTIVDPLTDSPIFIDTTSTPTRAVLGESVISVNYGGYYKLRLTGLGLPQSKYVNNKESSIDLCGIMSLQYTSLDMTTAFGDSAIPVIHRGAPTIISSPGIQVIDPETNKTVKTLGPKNAVIINIERKIRPTADQQKVLMAKEKPKD